jgi:hypothetical protein
MRWQISNLDIDGSIPAQKRLFSSVDNVISLRQHEQGLRLWPSRHGLDIVRQHVQSLMSDPQSKQIVFYGTGDLNHLSSVFIEELPESAKPLTVVLFDNHPDWFALPPRYHCGNWVANVLKLDWVEKVILIGQNSDDLKGRDFWFSPFSHLLSGRLVIIPFEKRTVRVPLVKADNRNISYGSARTICTPSSLGSDLQFPTVSKLGVDKVMEEISKLLAGKNVYIAIDKDVLREVDAQSDWEQGRLPLEDLLSILSSINKQANIVGADVCGERAPNPLKNFIKRIDAGRLFEPSITEQDFIAASALNEKSNLAIIDALTAMHKTTAKPQEVLCI